MACFFPLYNRLFPIARIQLQKLDFSIFVPFSFARRISPTKRISFAEQISPVPPGTDIIAKRCRVPFGKVILPSAAAVILILADQRYFPCGEVI